MPWSRLKPRKKYWLAFPPPACWVMIIPGTVSIISPSRRIGRVASSSATTVPCVAEVAMPIMLSCRPSTTTVGRRTALVSAGNELKPGALVFCAMADPLTRKTMANATNRPATSPVACNKSVARTNPKPNMTMLAEPGISAPWANPWKKAKPSCQPFMAVPVECASAKGRNKTASPTIVLRIGITNSMNTLR